MSFWRLYYHLVWATKNREHLLTPEVEKRLYPYLIGKAADMGGFVYAINGWCDHVHLVVAISPQVAVADIVKRLKGASSHDLNHPSLPAGQFAWQRGYGALSLGERQRPDAEAYVARQKQHHEAQTMNVWLERSAEFDEGPIDRGLTQARAVLAMHDDAGSYDADSPPF